jgi:hypothetical protein
MRSGELQAKVNCNCEVAADCMDTTQCGVMYRNCCDCNGDGPVAQIIWNNLVSEVTTNDGPAR